MLAISEARNQCLKSEVQSVKSEVQSPKSEAQNKNPYRRATYVGSFEVWSFCPRACRITHVGRHVAPLSDPSVTDLYSQCLKLEVWSPFTASVQKCLNTSLQTGDSSASLFGSSHIMTSYCVSITEQRTAKSYQFVLYNKKKNPN
jgi:hypothetical protein